jgi:replication factor C subunit 3/5
MAVQEQLALVAKKEGFSISADLGARIAVASQRNLRRALLMMEVAYVQHGAPLPEDTKVNPPDWELYIAVSTGC